MSISGMMRTGISGMNAQANRLSTVAENIANSDTTGYKRASVEFSSVILPDSNGNYNSGGLKTDVRYAIGRAGPLEFTNSGTDLSIGGNGFFIVADPNGQTFLTRAGSFVPDGNGYLVNAAGFRLLGVPAGTEGGLANGTADLVPITTGQGFPPSAEQTTTGRFFANLPVGAVDTDDPSVSSLVIYDSVGRQSFLDLSFQKTATDNAWDLTVTDESGTATTFAITFDPDTGLISGPDPATITIAGPSGDIVLDLSGMTELAYDYDVRDAATNGGRPAKVDSVEIDADGVVYFRYDDGSLAEAYRIRLATVTSPDRLTPLPGNVYQPNMNSGGMTVGYPESGAFGSIISGALEGSNVDIAEELTAMIESQRAYTANSKVFQTGSDLLDILVNLKR
jgi:flagellar hook protein FlgE